MIERRKPDPADDASRPGRRAAERATVSPPRHGGLTVHGQELPTVETSFFITWLIVKDADSCRAGNSASVPSILATYA